ncbi:MAG TPA: acyl-[ACP]--phospholipid O-acyltransferase [Bryobacteraceae bacterium]|nr:acyl-[ACP]--phospholipid O-acyltransferase [Bryobacteraceae bacterium]
MAQNSFKDLLKNGGFHSFLWTQFLGAFNDNVYKILVSMRAVHVAANTGSGSMYLSLAGVVFVVPFLLFSGYSGHLADVVSKRKVLISVKVFEIFVMCLGLAAFFSNRIELMLAVLFLMALHSTIFSPAKYGIVPEMLPDKDLSRANGLLEMSTFVAIVLGTSIGSFLFAAWKDEPWKMGVVTLVVAVAGFFTSLRITRVPASGSTTPFRKDPFAEVWIGTKHLLKERPLTLTVLGISYFWFLGALFQMDLFLFGSEVLKETDLRVGLLVTALAIGIGIGSMLAGRLSGNKVELGLVPLGAVLMGIFCIVLYMSRGSYTASVISLSLLGVTSGLFIVPLNAYLQQRSESHEKGRIIATNNFYNTIGLLLASGALTGMHDKLHMSPDKLMLVFGVVTLVSSVYIVSVVPEFLVRFVLWMTTHTLFKIRIIGQESVPFRGPALLVSNHMSHIDGFLINACIQRFIRFMVWKPYYEMPALNWFFRLGKAIPVGTSGPRDVIASIRAARKELEAGHMVCIFAEGAISRTGNLLPFRRGLEKIVDGLDVPIIPVHLDRLWGSIFSFERGRFLWKWPKRIPYPVTVSFGKPMPATSTAHDVRRALLDLGSEATMHTKDSGDLLDLRFARTAKKNWSRFAMADTNGRELTYGKALIASLLIAGWVRRNRRDDAMIGLLLPSSIGGALANIGVMASGKVPVNLNFTAGRESMRAAVEQCGLRTVVTSKVFLEKAKIEAPEGCVFLEDILAVATGFQKLRTAVTARLAPSRMLIARSSRTPDSLATVIFSSGSSGIPKGVMLSHHNILANIQAMAQVFWISDTDRIVGVLPFFHSFGFTVTIWLPLLNGCGALYHTNPMEANKIGELVAKHKGTFLLSTPTFCASYTRKCAKEEFQSLRFVLLGAEKLRDSVATAFREKFGLELLEGYGCTEMSPVVAVNSPNFEAGRDTQLGNKPGTVGHPLPGIAVKVVHTATMEPLPPESEGLLLVKGPNRMLGYLDQPERTAETLHDGWYITGDIGAIDDEGFIRITDRLARFSKIGGEMVPHLKVEESIYAIIGDHPCAVTGIPDEQRGERLVVLYTRPDTTPAELWRALSETELPKLWIPKRENVYQVDSLPTLGTGKLDLMGVKARAQQLAAVCAAQSSTAH